MIVVVPLDVPLANSQTLLLSYGVIAVTTRHASALLEVPAPLAGLPCWDGGRAVGEVGHR
jgi:hypothetical protein